MRADAWAFLPDRDVFISACCDASEQLNSLARCGMHALAVGGVGAADYYLTEFLRLDNRVQAYCKLLVKSL